MRCFVLLLVLVMLAPTSEAGWFSKPVQIEIGDTHAGTALRFNETSDGNVSTVLVQVQDSPEADLVHGFHALDRYGVEQPVDIYRVDILQGDTLTSSELCYALQQSSQSIRHDLLSGNFGGRGGGSSTGGGLGLSRSSRSVDSRQTVYFGTSECAGRMLPKAKMTEGQELTLAYFFPEERGNATVENTVSAPAVATTFSNRPALEFRYDLTPLFRDEFQGASGTVTFTLAQDQAVPVKVESTFILGGKTSVGVSELAGSKVGEGYVLPSIDGTTVSDHNPAGTFASFDGMRLDDAAFGLSYPYDEALASIMADPTVRFADFAGDGSNIQLQSATFDRQMRDPSAPSAPTDGGWHLLFVRPAGEWFAVDSVKVHVAPMLPAVIHNKQSPAAFAFPFERVPPKEMATSRTLASVAAAFGIGPGQAEHLEWELYELPSVGRVMQLSISQASEEGGNGTVGKTLDFDPVAGGLTGVLDTRAIAEEQGLLAPLPPRNYAPAAADAGAAALVGPSIGEDVGGYVAFTGLALLALAIKFLLIPLFTRLRRDRLLDNPMRVRLYERIRAEPGIHQAELVDYAGIGEGATRHHLKQLTRHRLLVETHDGGFTRYFAAGEVPPEVARSAAALRAGGARAVYDLLAAEPDLSLREAASRLGMSAPSVHRAKKKLEKAGLLPLRAGR